MRVFWFRGFRWTVVTLPLVALGALLLPTASHAGSRVKYFELDTQRDFLAGTLEGVALDPLGTLSLADRAERVADLAEPFLLSAARHPEGWVVGTGNDGRVLLVNKDGSVSTLLEADEPEVFAVAVTQDGDVLAGTSPDGKVYRVRAGESEELFDPEQRYIWDLLASRDGSVLVATGTEGKLFRIAKSGSAELVFDSEDTHLRALKELDGGEVLIGTAGDGLILRMGSDGDMRTIYDAAQPEVVAFAEGSSGVCYAAVLASEASQVDLAARPGAAPGSGAAAGQQQTSGGKVTVTMGPAVPSQVAPTSGSRPPGFQGPRSEILRIQPGGRVDTLWSFDAETVYSLSWQTGRLWVGTGLEGKVFSLRDSRMVLEKDLDERQVVAVLAGPKGPAYATTNAAALFSSAGEPERSGTFTSPVLDAAQTSEFGSLSWVGDLPKGTEVAFSARSGMSAHPDRTWSEWSAPTEGSQVSLAQLPAGKYLQWRARLDSGNGDSPSLTRVALSYRQQNLPPRIKKLEVMPPGEVVVPPGFVPGSQTFEPTRSGKDGFFSTLKSSKNERERQRKTLWKQGYRTISWQAEDPNGDDLRYALLFRRAGSETKWLAMDDDLESDFYSFDATALPDGIYRFKLVAYDRREQDLEAPLRTEEISEPTYVDNSPPRLLSSKVASGKLQLVVEDRMSPLAEAEYSIDAGEWSPTTVSDGLIDGASETLSIDLPKAGSAQLLLLRVADVSFNVVTYDLSTDLP
ncbi:MAG: hypothetical protein ACE5GX_13995 [Thermoanaerobaculia bacterium]